MASMAPRLSGKAKVCAVRVQKQMDNEERTGWGSENEADMSAKRNRCGFTILDIGYSALIVPCSR